MRRTGARRAGIALEQVAIAMGVVAILLAAVVSAIPGRRDLALARQSVRDAQSIANAAVQYWWRTHAWPAGVSDLTTSELPSTTAATNPFGFPYVISGAGRSVLVSTTIPLSSAPIAFGTGVSAVTAAGQTVVTVSRTLTDDGTAGAAFTKTHLYRE